MNLSDQPKNSETNLTPEEFPGSVAFTEKDISDIERITSGTDTVPGEIRMHASFDVIKTLENNHPFNHVWRNENGEIMGYLAFEDFAEKEAYAKYFATNGSVNENPFSVIPDLVQRAKSLGYTKIHFHGFNKRLNKVLEHFGFHKIATDRMGEYSADHFELRLDKEKEQEIDQKAKESFENKYLNHLISETQKIAKALGSDKIKNFNSAESEMHKKLSGSAGFELNEKRKVILKLKLARYLQRHDIVDTNTLFDAIVETPKFLDNDKGGFDKLLEIHEQKTLQKIAEMRRQKAEQKGDESLNPYEALFQAESGKYYLARLLNMPHLEEESIYMDHCVGTSDSYISKMKRGEAEILSIRSTADHKPILTIEYFPKTREINQIKGRSDQYLTGEEEYFSDVIEILKRMRDSKTDTGEKRNFSKINPSELENFEVKPYHLLTENGEVSFYDFDPNSDQFVLKIGKMDITENMSKQDYQKIIHIVLGIRFEANQIAYGIDDVNPETRIYLGDWNPEIFKRIREYPEITHRYASVNGKNSLDKEIFYQTIETDLSIQTPADAEAKLKERSIYLTDWGKDILYKTEFSKTKESYELLRFTVAQIGFQNGATTDEIYKKANELGLELCPAEVGPNLRLSYPEKEWMLIAMKQIVGRGGFPRVWRLGSEGAGLRLGAGGARPADRWFPGSEFVFRFRKIKS